MVIRNWCHKSVTTVLHCFAAGPLATLSRCLSKPSLMMKMCNKIEMYGSSPAHATTGMALSTSVGIARV